MFRATLPQRSVPYPGSTGNGANKSSSLNQVGGIFCNPGDWPPDTTVLIGPEIFPIVPTCPRDIADIFKEANYQSLYGTGTSSQGKSVPLLPSALSLATDTANNLLLADRIVSFQGGGKGECARLTAVAGDVGGGNATPYTHSDDVYWSNWNQLYTGSSTSNSLLLNPCKDGPGTGCGSVDHEDYWATWVLDPTGSDPIFNVSTGIASSTLGYPGALNQGCNGSTVYDPLNLCGNVMSPQVYNKTIVPAPPFNMNVTSAPWDTGASRYDFLFVVTPTSIMLSDMQNITAAGAPYQPYRFKTDLDCIDPDTGFPAINPDATNAANSNYCNYLNAINTYGLKLQDVGSSGDPPASDPNRAGVFPVCVIQPN
jgi:hypothetical protein